MQDINYNEIKKYLVDGKNLEFNKYKDNFQQNAHVVFSNLEMQQVPEKNAAVN
jgi:hypothetical protein